jgi:glucose/arabinose dehydrogenase
LALSQDGNTIYASTYSNVYSWQYNAQDGRVNGNPTTIIENMGVNEGHTTRTLLMSKKVPSLLLVSRGSAGNLDYETLDINSGASTIKAFNVTNMTSTAYQQPSDGMLLGWGLRNSVGVAEDPITGAIYSVENSVDNLNRNGQLINQNNPGEEMNFNGYINGTQSDVTGKNYGYPTCFAAWNVSEIPDNSDLQTGKQFAIGIQNATLNDSFCQEDRVAPRITFQAHMAPLDMKFNTQGTGAWVSMHGSWFVFPPSASSPISLHPSLPTIFIITHHRNRDSPTGYKLSFIQFDGSGSPTAPANSTTAAVDIVSNPDLSKCPSNCFRPVGLAWDSRGRLYMSSDASGEIYVVTKMDGSGVDDVKAIGGGSSSGGNEGSGTGTAAAPTASASAGTGVRKWEVGMGSYWVAGAAVVGGALPF